MSADEHVQLRDTSYYLINPGTIGEPRSAERRATYMILDLERRTVTTRHVDYQASAEFVAAHRPGIVSRFGLAGFGLQAWRADGAADYAFAFAFAFPLAFDPIEILQSSAQRSAGTRRDRAAQFLLRFRRDGPRHASAIRRAAAWPSW